MSGCSGEVYPPVIDGGCFTAPEVSELAFTGSVSSPCGLVALSGVLLVAAALLIFWGLALRPRRRTDARVAVLARDGAGRPVDVVRAVS